MDQAPVTAIRGNRYDLRELAGAFGDLGTLIPFVAAYVAIVKMDPAPVLLGFGLALIVVGAVFRTPFPVQPMKAIGAVAVGQSAHFALTASTVAGAGLVTGVIWLVLGATGMARRLSEWVPRPALLGVILGLGFSFMLEGIRMMATSPWLGGVLLVMTLLLLSRPQFPAMLGLLAAGFLIALVEQPGLWAELRGIRLSPGVPSFAWPSLTWNDLWLGAVFLALPQLPLTFGNAMLAITEENNRLFPQHPVSEGKVAVSTGLLNLWSSAIGGIPMCHGAGGMAGHVRFGATTGGASIMLGILLTGIALLLGDSIGLLLRVFPQSVLGVILFLAGAELALGSREPGPDKIDRFVMLATAALAVMNVGIAVIFGILGYHASRRGWLKF
jgi:predicted benzoate:H+ symporter BenE